MANDALLLAKMAVAAEGRGTACGVKLREKTLVNVSEGWCERLIVNVSVREREGDRTGLLRVNERGKHVSGREALAATRQDGSRR